MIYNILPDIGIAVVFCENLLVKLLEAFTLHSFKTSGMLQIFISEITRCRFNEFIVIIVLINLSKK